MSIEEYVEVEKWFDQVYGKMPKAWSDEQRRLADQALEMVCNVLEDYCIDNDLDERDIENAYR